MKSPWNLRIDELQNRADLVVRNELERIIAENPENGKYIEEFRNNYASITRGLRFIKDAEERNILEFCNYIPGQTPQDALIISVVNIGARSGKIKSFRVFLPAKKLSALKRTENLHTMLFE